MNMNIENFKEEHFALYQIWHRGATTYIPNAQIWSLINFHFMECFTKNHPVLEIHMEPITPNTVFGPVFECAKYGQVRYP